MHARMKFLGLILSPALLVGCGATGDSISPGSPSAQGPTVVSWPIAREVYTTAQQQILPVDVPANTTVISPANVSLYAQYGYSAWQVGPPLAYVKRTELAPGYSGAANAARLLNFFTMSDIHIADKESPAQPLYVGWSTPPGPGLSSLSSAYSPVLLSTTHVLDAAVQTINALHKITPFDFGISLGDDANNTQYNELRWFIDVLDGKVITPSSGAHLGADTIDYQMPFQAAGLDKSIPWYQVIGNHDQFWLGSDWENAKTLQAHVGSTILDMSDSPDPTSGGVNGWGAYMGVINGTTPFGDLFGAGPDTSFPVPPTVIPDLNRHSLVTSNSTCLNWMTEFFNTTTTPVGHGFTQANLANNTACYSFLPKSDLPIKVIALDDTAKVSTAPNFAAGYLDPARIAWLTNELQAGQDQGQLMIIAAHIPIRPATSLTNTTTTQLFADSNQEQSVLQLLHTYPNLILWIAGHRHVNVVTPQPNNTTDPTDHPERSFWEVETPSLRDFPQEFRTFDIRRNSDNTISILVTDVDPAVTGNSPAYKSRGYAIGAGRLFLDYPLTNTTSQAYNAELVKQLTPAMQAKIANYGSPLK